MRGRQFLNDWQAKLWSRFFCLSVYVTMYLNDHQRSAFYESIGLNTTQFNRCALWGRSHGRAHPIRNSMCYVRLSALVVTNGPALCLPYLGPHLARSSLRLMFCSRNMNRYGWTLAGHLAGLVACMLMWRQA